MKKGVFMLVPMVLLLLLYGGGIAVVIYAVVLATRFVRAVEKIAQKM